MKFRLKLFTTFICFAFAFLSPITVSAASDLSFDKTNVMNDLQSSLTKDGLAFNVQDYTFNSAGVLEMLNVVEYSYTYQANRRDNYGLYLYFYNPQKINVSSSSILNKVQMAVAYGADGEPSMYGKFDLKFCSRSTGTYSNLFLKYKVVFSAADKTALFNRLDSNERRYDFSGVELLTVGQPNATEYGMGAMCFFTGYASGCGSDVLAASTLSCRFEKLDTVQLQVQSTWYRPEGAKEGGSFVQDQLSSVYFAIPNYLFDRYGSISAVHVEWYEYLTREAFVQGNQTIYDRHKDYVGKTLNGYNSNVFFGMGADVHVHQLYPNTIMGARFGYNLKNLYVENSVNKLSYLFSSGNKFAYDYSITSKEFLSYVRAYSDKHDKTLRGKYSADLFYEAVSEGRTFGHNEVTVQADDGFSLTSYMLNKQSWWDKFWGNKTYTGVTYDGIKGVHMVSASDFKETPAVTSDALFIDKSDYSDFKAYYDSAVSNDKTVALLRFAVTDYISMPVTNYDQFNLLGVISLETCVDKNAYMFQQTAFLDFDVIDVTFFGNGVYRVIPAVASPIDVIGGGTPPVETPSGCVDFDWLFTFLGFLLLVIVLVVLAPILGFLFTVIKLLFAVLLLPFRLIASAFKKRG